MIEERELTKVLLVKDDPVRPRYFGRGLDALGGAVTVVAAGEEAMDVLHGEQCAMDCLLVDIVLPRAVGG